MKEEWTEEKFISRLLVEIGKIGKENLQIVDIGCGEGRLLLRIAHKIRNAGCVGFDLSSKNLSLTSKLVKKLKFSNLTLVNGTALVLPFRDFSFDLILCSFLLMFFTHCEIKVIVEEIHRVLCRNGVLFATVFSADGAKSSQREKIDEKTLLVTGQPTPFFTECDVRGIFKSFEIKSLIPVSYFDTSHGYPHSHNIWLLLAVK